MQTLNDVHHQFASYFGSPFLRPYLYLLSKKMADGHVCLDVAAIRPEEWPEEYKDKIMAAPPLAQDPLVADEEGLRRPFVYRHGLLYMHRYYMYETLLLDRIRTFVQQGKAKQAERASLVMPYKNWLQEQFPVSVPGPDWQFVACLTATLQDFTIITGGPGTGKTTTVAKILALQYRIDPDMKVALAAPTGKAAARIAESLQGSASLAGTAGKNGLKPFTLHRLLGWKKDSPYFQHGPQSPLPYDLIVVDEASMIDLALFAKLLMAIGPGTRVIVLGDKDQLASVEAGSLLSDLCKAQPRIDHFDADRVEWLDRFLHEGHRLQGGHVTTDAGGTLFQHIVELKHSYRFEGDKGIGMLSRAVLRSDMARTEALWDQEDKSGELSFDFGYDPAFFNEFIEQYRTFINEDDLAKSLRELGRLKILCAVKMGAQGLHALNAAVENYFSRQGALMLDGPFYHNRPVMVMRNNYALGLFNGDLGLIRKDEDGTAKAWFLDRDDQGNETLRWVLPAFLTNIETAFAMTIHKSQGSEFEQVFMVLPEKDMPILTRELLYTGITRAKKKISIQASRSIWAAAQGRSVERGSGIGKRMAPQGPAAMRAD